MPRFFFGSGECRWNQIVLDRTLNCPNSGSGDCLADQPGRDIKLSWLAGAVLSMKGAHPFDKVPDKTLNCPPSPNSNPIAVGVAGGLLGESARLGSCSSRVSGEWMKL